MSLWHYLLMSFWVWRNASISLWWIQHTCWNQKVMIYRWLAGCLENSWDSSEDIWRDKESSIRLLDARWTWGENSISIDRKHVIRKCDMWKIWFILVTIMSKRRKKNYWALTRNVPGLYEGKPCCWMSWRRLESIKRYSVVLG